MELTTKIDKLKNLRIHEVKGVVTRDALLQKLAEIYSIPDLTKDINVLWDLREADLSNIHGRDVREIKEFVKTRWAPGGKSRAAFIVMDDLCYGYSRMYQMNLEVETRNEIKVFRDYHEGMKWIVEGKAPPASRFC